MTRMALKLLLALGLVFGGWSIGRAQARMHDFEIVIDAPVGRTRVECVKGCQLAWIERMVPGTVTPEKTEFWYECGGNSPTQRCGSGRIGGWIVK